jgi:predicted nucleic acid-binding protein
MVGSKSMVERPTVYVETTVISYLAARPSQDIRVAAHQEMTAEWWARKRAQFDFYISQLVVDEASAGNRDAADARLRALEGVPLLALTEPALLLAERLVAEGAVPPEAGEDALHVALAAVNGIDYLVTWNCRHIANATMRSRIEEVCVAAGHDPPIICTPEE